MCSIFRTHFLRNWTTSYMLIESCKVPIEILIVDDEPQAGKYFQKAFGSKYHVVTATSADEAERIIFSDAHEIAIVITDQRMPGRNGASLLSNIRRRRPEIVRILTSAYSDLDSAIEAVNSGEMFRYITKPWDLQSLEVYLDEAATFYMLQRECNFLIREKLSAVERTILRDRVNSFASMAVALSGYRNAKSTVYNFLKDSLAETACRPVVRSQMSAMRAEDHWRLAVEEAQLMVGVASKLSAGSPESADAPFESEPADIVGVIEDCASALRDVHKLMSISIRASTGLAPIRTHSDELRGIVSRLMAPISTWTAPGTTIQVQVKNMARQGEQGGAAITFEIRNFDAQKAAADCLIYTPPCREPSAAAVEFLRAALELGHRGGSIKSPPSRDGVKHITIMLPNDIAAVADVHVPNDWIVDLNEACEKWALSAYRIAS